MCNLSLATSEQWKDRETGEKRERTEWHRVSIFADGLVDIASKYLAKGSKIYVEGQLETRKWQDQSGQDRYSTEVVLRPFNSRLVMLSAQGSGTRDGARDERRPAPSGADNSSTPAGDYDDEIPF